MIRAIIFLAVLSSSLLVAAASLLDLNFDFRNDGWKEFLTRTRGRGETSCVESGSVRALEVPAGISFETQKFPYSRGTIRLSAEVETTGIEPGARPYHVGWIALVFYDAGGRELGHTDLVNTGKASGWKEYVLTIPDVRRDAAGFRLSVQNLGKNGVLRIRNLSLRIDVPDGETLCGDPGFRGDFGVDHWNYVREGVDWDRLALKGSKGEAKYVAGLFPDGGKSLLICNDATFRSNRYPYDGEPLLFGGWAKYHNRTQGKTGWAWANLQLVLFDREGKVIGHHDLTPLEKPEMPWTYFSCFIPAGSLLRSVAGVELWARGFEGSTGEAFFDEIQLIRFSSDSASRKKYDASAATLKLNLSRPDAEAIRPVWNATDISYADKLNSPVVRALLADLRKNGIEHLRLREFFQGCRIVSKLDGEGNPVYNWKTLDPVIDWAVREQGFKLTATMESTPNLMATVPAENPRAHANRTTPRDIRQWGKVVSDTVEHWIERYGLDTVKTWEFECWNEPVSERYFQGTHAEFVQIYEAYLDAMCEVEKRHGCKLNIGTFSGVGNSPLFPLVFEAVKAKGKLASIDFVSMHVYAGFVSSFDSLARNIQTMRKTLENYPELASAPLLITEFNGSSMSNANCDSSVAAAFYVKAARVFLDTGVKRGYYFTPIDYQYARMDQYFTGDLGMFTKNGIPKPVFNSQVLLNKLTGGKRVALDVSNEPADGIAVLDGGTLKLLLTSFDEANLGRKGTIKLAVEVPDAPRFGHCTMYRIDRNHANSYEKYLELGKPVISPETDEQLRRAAAMPPEPFPAFRQRNGKLAFELELPLNSVCYMEFEP